MDGHGGFNAFEAGLWFAMGGVIAVSARRVDPATRGVACVVVLFGCYGRYRRIVRDRVE